jgi:putative nucleotidyltransferase with HDIG domain
MSEKDFVPEEMMPIPIEDLVNGVKTPTDLFIRLSQVKFVCVAHAGTAINVDQLKNYKSHEVTYLWVMKKEYYKLVHQTTSLAGVILSRTDVDVAKKTEFLAKASASIFHQIDHMGLDTNSFSTARQVSEAVLSLSDHHSMLSTIMLSLSKTSDQLLAHSIAVSVMSTMIGQGIGYEKKATLEKLALAGLLHDIGLKAIPAEILRKQMAAMTPDEFQIYESHSFKGMQMLQSLGIVPDDVLAMIYEHHENSVGQGFPQHLRDVKLHPMSKVVALADAFANLILPSVNNPKPKSPKDALIYMGQIMGNPFNKEATRALARIVDSNTLKVA